MQATVQPQVVKSTSIRSGAKLQQTKAASRPASPASGPKASTRFVHFLMTALAGCAV